MNRLIVTLGIALSALSIACGRQAPQPEVAEPPTLDLTHWTDTTELFMEFPPFAAGQTVRFAVHLTRLSDFSAMTAGRPRIEMTPESGGTTTVLPGNEPSRPGVFRVEGALPAAGRYRWALLVDAPGVQDRHDLGVTTVFATEAEAIADAEARAVADATAIGYLKEPQWTNGFATAPAAETDMRLSIRVPAVIEALTGGEAVVAAPVTGRFVSTGLPGVGTRVTADEELGVMQPRTGAVWGDRATLAVVVTEAEVAVDAARAELARSERLLAERAVAGRRVEDARRAVTVAEARLAAGKERLQQRDEALRTGGATSDGNTFVVRAPIDGVIAEVVAAIGASYEEGALLFRVVRTDRVELQAHVPPSALPLDPSIAEVALELPGRPEPVTVAVDHAHYAGIIDPRTLALPVQFHADNRAGLLLVGQTGTAILYSGGRQRMLTVPQQAVLTEAGRPYVFVQTGGETFSRRYIEITARDGGVVGVRSGIVAGERVVTRGAYDVQLASAASGLPAEGHVH